MLKPEVVRTLLVCIMALLLPLSGSAGEPSAADLDAAIKSGDFAGYQANLTAWLNQKVPAGADSLSEASSKTLLGDPAFANVLAQRQLIAKVGAANLGTFAKAGDGSKAFLKWLLGNTSAMDLFLEATTPTGLKARDEDKWTIPITSLDLWKKIYAADPDSKEGQWLKFAIGIAINPPPSEGTHSKIPIDPVGRYKYFKTADKNNELFPSFRTLTAWEYSKVVNNNGPTASDEEFTWGREMIRTFRPDFLEKQQVVNIVSMVWRRASPNPYTGMQTMLQGGGKCGPRSFFGVFINQAFGIPAIGVGQPSHACVAYKAFDPAMEPQPGSPWKVAYGGGWNVSKLDGLAGPDFVDGVIARSQVEQFSRVEHLRWLASSLASKDLAGAVMGIARKMAQEKPATKIDMNGSLKAEEAEADAGTVTESRFGKSKAAPAEPAKPQAVAPTEPIKVVNGILHVDAASFAKTGGEISWGGQFPHVLVHDCFTGGKQIYFQQQMKSQWADYVLDIPASGTYEITMKAACVNDEQVLEVNSGDRKLAKVDIPLSFGLWQVTKPVELKLEKGIQTIRVETPTTEHKRGIALRWFELKPKGN